MLKKIDWDVLNTYIENNLIVSNKHPDYDIWILNYSPKTQYNQGWDIYTMSCRGLIVDADGNILARTFQKFKNYEEHDPNDSVFKQKNYEIFEKMDGSLIILFHYSVANEWIVASRGSFISEQSEEARKMLNGIDNIYDKLSNNFTYIFEVLYSENRIVVNYGNRWELIMLACIDTTTGIELKYDDMVNGYSPYFTIVKKYNITFNDLSELKNLDEENREGFVIKYENGFRVKVKFEEYVRLHGILTNVSNVTIWEHLMNKYDFDILWDRVPDEMNEWLKKTINSLEMEFNNIERLALKEFMRIYHINNIITRKEFAMEALKSKYNSILFNMYDRKSYDKIIWKMIKPIRSTPFRDGYEYIA